ncbi:hypothetical protein BS47DRAFT_1291554 [Hydnum rufescens UP504]|uniref:Prokaryotic-type class I peptide chain release factors domain-containing protein n=1 Tax=Hydnum rufescens UP504 TaxID=1448309 RepID=A0A9P6DWZ2_9AGAM|nr:hypothetical protein BS47DRAFT_1291554 [Hydnum rufescens UP504]
MSRLSSALVFVSLLLPKRSIVTLAGAEALVARDWLERFSKRPLQRSDVQLGFARSSGPGGQNVNKLNTKAIARCPIDSPWIPFWTRENLKSTPAYVSSTQSLMVSSTISRSQAQNVEDCLRKLHALIVTTVSSAIQNEPSEVQKDRVRKFQAAEKAKMLVEKKKRKGVKSGRGRVHFDD